MKIITSWATLMTRAREVGAARVAGDAARLAAAESRLADYEEAIKMSDEVILP